jgi:acyl-CoA thioesterase FadM
VKAVRSTTWSDFRASPRFLYAVTFYWPVEIGWLPIVFSGTKERAIRFAHEMKDDETGEVVARTVLVAVHIDTATRKARPFPSDVRDQAYAMINGQQS